MTGILIRRSREDTETQRIREEGHANTGTEVGVMQLQVETATRS